MRHLNKGYRTYLLSQQPMVSRKRLKYLGQKRFQLKQGKLSLRKNATSINDPAP